MRRALRKWAEKSLYVFCRDVLGYSDLYESLNQPLCEFVQQPTKQLVLLPRGHFKSTIISVSYVLWLLAKWPDTRILIANATLDNPRKWVAEQLQHLRGNTVLRWVFPEMCPATNVEEFGFVESYTVPSRRATWGDGRGLASDQGAGEGGRAGGEAAGRVDRVGNRISQDFRPLDSHPRADLECTRHECDGTKDSVGTRGPPAAAARLPPPFEPLPCAGVLFFACRPLLRTSVS